MKVSGKLKTNSALKLGFELKFKSDTPIQYLWELS